LISGDVKMVTGEGMPQTGIPTRKGNLYIKFTVDFPDIPFLKSEDLETVSKSLHQTKKKTADTTTTTTGSTSTVQLVDVTKDSFQFEPLDDGSSESGNRRQQQSRGGRGGQQEAQCATQ
jgi:DnaJ-class molecular chaperone